MCTLNNQATELNKLICKELRNRAEKRSFLLRYALDSDYLPDDIYSAFVDENNGKILNGKPWLVLLIWIRHFFEIGDGSNFRSVLDHIKNIDHQLADKFWLKPHVTQSRGDHYEIPLNRFLAECFVLHGGNDGTVGKDSRLWKILRKLTDLTANNQNGIEPSNLLNQAEDDVDIPRFFHHACDQSPDDFMAILKAIQQSHPVEGFPWTKRIATSPGWKQKKQNSDPVVSVGIQRNGNAIQRAVRIVQSRDTAPTLSFKQGDVLVVYPINECEILVTVEWFDTRDIKPSEPMKIHWARTNSAASTNANANTINNTQMILIAASCWMQNKTNDQY